MVLETDYIFYKWSKYLDNMAIIPYDVIYNMTIIPHGVIITGDLNFYVDNKSDDETRRWYSILDFYVLTQDLNSVTPEGCHTLDLVISRNSSSMIVEASSVSVPCFSKNKLKSFGDHQIYSS